MLVLLTGNRQVGKTRFLEKLIDEASGYDIRCIGVVSPGVWAEDVNSKNGALRKTGIDALLLPDNIKIPFATARSAQAHYNEGRLSTTSAQADSAKLGWKIYDNAIERINEHFDMIQASGMAPSDLLIVDELGSLEFTHNKGLTSAMRLLERPSATFPIKDLNAIVIVRPELIDAAKIRLAPVWGEPLCIDISKPDDYLGTESLIRSLSSASLKS